MSRRNNISAGAVLLLAALYFFSDLYELTALLIASMAHEAGHVAAIVIFGGRIADVKLSAAGFCMSYIGVHTVKSEVISLVSGPLFGILFAFLTSYFGGITQNRLLLETAGISIIFSAYNLLPALPLDGGRILYIVLSQRRSREYAKKFLYISGAVSGTALIFAGLYSVRVQFCIGLIIAGIWVLIAQTGIVKNMSVM